MAAVNEHLLLIRYTPPVGLKKLLKTPKGKGLAASPEIVQTSALLPEGSQWMVIINPSGMGEVIIQFLAANNKIQVPQAAPILARALAALAKAPPVGLGVKLAPAGLEAQLVIPPETIQALGRAARELRGELPE